MNIQVDGVRYVPDTAVDNASACDQALNALMAQCGDFDDIKIVDYLNNLFQALWREGEGFNGKRPFRNSGWSLDLTYSLIMCGYIPGTIELDEYGDIDSAIYDQAEADRLISDLIKYCFYRN